MKNNFLKRIGALTLCAAMSVSGITAFASDNSDCGEVISTKYFKFNNDCNVWEHALQNSENHIMRVSTEKSYSGNRSFHLISRDCWWKQHFHTSYGCELGDNGTIHEGDTTRYVNPTSYQYRFSMKVTGDMTRFESDTRLTSAGGADLLMSDASVSKTTEEKDGNIWTTYSWEGSWTNGGWLLGLGGTYAADVYIDDIKLEYKTDAGWSTIINEDFEDSVNVPVNNINSAKAVAINDSTLRISWKNPPLSSLTKLQIIDVTDEANPTTVYAEGEGTETAVASAGKNAVRYYDVTGLSAGTFKKYKIVAATNGFADAETIVSGRTHKSGVKITDYNYDKNGFSFGGSWQVMYGDSPEGYAQNSEWYVSFDEKRSGASSFACDLSGNKDARVFFWLNRTLTAGKTYAVEFYAKTAKNGVPASTAIFAEGVGSAGYWKINNDEWTLYNAKFTPTADTTLSALRIAVNAGYNPTTVYIDDIRVYEEGGEEILGTVLTEAGHQLKNLNVTSGDNGAKMSWTETTIDNNGVNGLGVNLYHTSPSGVVTKLNTTPIAWTTASGDTACEYALDQVDAGTYSVKAVSCYGIEGDEITYTVKDIDVTEVEFNKVEYWSNGFDKFCDGADIYNEATKLEKGDITGWLTVVNNKNAATPVSLIGALYKGSKLVDVLENKAEVAAGESQWLGVAFKVGEDDETDVSDYTMKLFVWDSLEGLTPLNGAAYELSGK